MYIQVSQSSLDKKSLNVRGWSTIAKSNTKSWIIIRKLNFWNSNTETLVTNGWKGVRQMSSWNQLIILTTFAIDTLDLNWVVQSSLWWKTKSLNLSIHLGVCWEIFLSQLFLGSQIQRDTMLLIHRSLRRQTSRWCHQQTILADRRCPTMTLQTRNMRRVRLQT